MLETLGRFVVEMMDYVLGWVLYLPRDAMLLVVAGLTSGILVAARKLTTDQDWLARAAADRKRLRELIRQARRNRDKEARKRHKATLLLIKTRSLRYEVKPLLVAIVPVALVATWCFSRLGYIPPKAGERLEVRAYLPSSAIGRLVHMAPVEGVQPEEGWIRRVVKDSPPAREGLWETVNAAMRSFFGAEASPGGVAVWHLRARGRPQAYPLRFHHAGRTYEYDLLVGCRRYSPPVKAFDGGGVQAVEVVMRPVKLFGVVGGVEGLFLPPWVVAYLLITIPLVYVLKRLLGVY